MLSNLMEILVKNGLSPYNQINYVAMTSHDVIMTQHNRQIVELIIGSSRVNLVAIA